MKTALFLLFLVLALCDRERSGSKIRDIHSKSVKRSHLHLRSDTNKPKEDPKAKKNRVDSIRLRSRRDMKESARESSDDNLRTKRDTLRNGYISQVKSDHGKSQGGGSVESNAKASKKRKETIWASSSDIVQREDLFRPPPPAKIAPSKPQVRVGPARRRSRASAARSGWRASGRCAQWEEYAPFKHCSP
jgi:hypothetical protein